MSTFHKKQENTKQHPVFSALCDPLMALCERTGLGRQRQWLMERTEGRTLEVGIGTGRNLQYLTGDDLYVGVDPEAAMLRKARRRARGSGQRVALVRAIGEALPFRAGVFQTAVICVTFCSVSDPELAGWEIRRVLRDGGKLVFLEHTRSSRPVKAWIQDRITPLTRRLNANCHHNRQTLESFRGVGLAVEEEPLKGDVLFRGMAWVDGGGRTARTESSFDGRG